MDAFECKKCGYCCQLDVVLKKEDIQNLKQAGKSGFITKRDGKKFLKHIDNFCIFYKDGLCGVYHFRPDVCRRFPYESDGEFSEKCKQRKDFSSRVERRIVEFMIQKEMQENKRW